MTATDLTVPPALDCCVVILNYNGGALVGDVLWAVLASESVRLGVVVVDNGSTDGSLETLEQIGNGVPDHCAGRRLVFLRAEANLGYPGGNNLGLYALPARYIVLLNSDAIVGPRTLASLIGFMDRTPRAGACGPRLDWPFSHGGEPTPAYLLRRALARRMGRYLHAWAGDCPRAVDWVAGTCLCLRAAALAEVGMLDEGIFMYFEDMDLCRRLRGRGWRVYFVPSVAVTHHNKPSYADRARQANYYRSLAHFYARHYGRPASLAIWLASRARLLLSR
jgi:N-acetylglucosaminyl-diphospho-decaprenol L-rhamnosyltransferase